MLNSNFFITKVIFSENNLSTNACKTIFGVLETNPQIVQLEVNNNSVDDDAIEYLAEVLMRLPKNREPLNITMRENVFTEKGAEFIAKALANDCPVSWLDLRKDKNILDAGVQKIANSLISNTHLIGLDLLSCGCGAMGAWAFADSLVENDTFKTLLLQDPLNEEAISALSSLLVDENCHLQNLYLWKCSLTSKDLDILCNALRNNNCLETLALSYNEINDLAALSIAKMVLRNKSIKKLQLGSNHFTSNFSGFISASLIQNSTLQYLDLSRNNLQSKGMWPITVALSDNHQLKSIDLRHNKMDSSSAEMISELLSKNDSLTLIRLSGNKFEDSGVSIFADSLKNNKTIKEIELDDVDITSEGFLALCKALLINTTLERITISKNRLSGKVMYAFRDVLLKNTTLTYVSLNECNIDDAGCHFIAEGLSNNFSLKGLELEKNLFTTLGFSKIIDALYMGEEYSYIVYNKHFESNRLIEMSNFIREDEYYNKVSTINKNIFDLADFFMLNSKQNDACLIKELNGFYSIKNILPLIQKYEPKIFKKTKCKDYKELNIGNGLVCQEKTMNRFFGITSDEE